jgi:hypothetical protein
MRDLVNEIRNDSVVLGTPIVLEMAIYRGKQQIYSDLSSQSLDRMAPFVESFTLLGVGDNLSLSLNERKSIIICRISEKGVLIIVTNEKIGTTLIKLKEITEKYGKGINELLEE